MEFEEQKYGATVVLSIAGRADAFGGPTVGDRLAEIIERGDVNIVVDCRGLSYISSVGLRALFVAARACQAEGGELVIAAATFGCKSVMEIAGFMKIINYFDKVEEAVSGISPDGTT